MKRVRYLCQHNWTILNDDTGIVNITLLNFIFLFVVSCKYRFIIYRLIMYGNPTTTTITWGITKNTKSRALLEILYFLNSVSIPFTNSRGIIFPVLESVAREYRKNDPSRVSKGILFVGSAVTIVTQFFEMILLVL